ncbi:MAG: SUMF1/EgtB/PvdO family nonheme iron enzyme, partial [Ardenticatenia bacterium]|nr:SUMF1/EgtB/PvdO family nonheme iron enzyme [Ardenticatenia bacterium]
MKTQMLTRLLIVVVSAGCVDALETQENSLGMKLMRVPAGQFQMGNMDSANGDFDEKPVHPVRITRSFWMSAAEVTNAQYEQFDPSHRALRGRHGLSREDDEAVIFVSWHDVVGFCKWLSERESKAYRLPTEAEWEYACRAGTTTAYHTGQTLADVCHKNQKAVWQAVAVPLNVGKTPPNAWGLHDMHGNVEEWCLDWYGPYEARAQADPVGQADGYVKVTRGGSHGTPIIYLRSANRMGTLPADKSWMIGFRVVQADLPEARRLPQPPAPAWAQDVSQESWDWSKGPAAHKPYWKGPIPFVKIPPDSNGPLYSRHNHCPAITWCDNGDLLAVWFSCNSESGRELTILGSRLKAGSNEWTPAGPFFQVPDRNLTGSALLNDGEGRLYFFNGLSAAQGYRTMLALVMRTSGDNGASWSEPRLINPRRNDPWESNQPIASVCLLSNGTIVLPSDAPLRRKGGGTALWMSRDGGKRWAITKGTIAGIHASVVERRDGELLALGRQLGGESDGRIPQSVSTDNGANWTYSPGPFPGIAGGQRLVLRRLREGAILCASFSGPPGGDEGMTFTDATGSRFR